MCPDKELLSAFFDGEVPEPWSSTIQSHVAVCPECSSAVASFKSLQASLGESVTPDIESRRGAMFSRIQAHEGSRPPSIWATRLYLPLPIAAAAAVVLAFLLGIFIMRPQANPDLAAKTRSSIPEIPSPNLAIPVSNGTQRLLDVLNGKDVEINITVQLPDSSILSVLGEPEMIMTSAGSGK